MARYRRNFIAGGTFFFTVKPAAPKSRLLVGHIGFACGLYGCAKTIPFETVAVCVLPNHIHAIWTLPPDDADYSLLRRLIKTKFSAYSPHTKNL
ncbi:TPA: transposase, partial [Neisseria gonorrhoeae]